MNEGEKGAYFWIELYIIVLTNNDDLGKLCGFQMFVAIIGYFKQSLACMMINQKFYYFCCTLKNC